MHAGTLDNSSPRTKQKLSGCTYIMPPEPLFHTYGNVEARVTQKLGTGMGWKLGFRLILALPLFHTPDCVSGGHLHTYDSSTSR